MIVSKRQLRLPQITNYGYPIGLKSVGRLCLTQAADASFFMRYFYCRERIYIVANVSLLFSYIWIPRRISVLRQACQSG
jgi:hypothetical protein